MDDHHSNAVIAGLFLTCSLSALIATVRIDNEYIATPAAAQQAITYGQYSPPIRSKQNPKTAPTTTPQNVATDEFKEHPDATPTNTLADASGATANEERQVSTVSPASGANAVTSRKDSKEISAAFETEVVAEVHRITNKARQKADLSELQFDDALADTAGTKADDIATNQYFAHTSPEGCDFTCLLAAAGYRATAWGENLMQYTATTRPTAPDLAKDTVSRWLKSDGHRENILNPNYTQQGIAVSQLGDTMYIVAHYAKPSNK